MLSRLFVLMQYLLPKYLLTALVYRLARISIPSVKNALIRGFLRLYDVELDKVRGRVRVPEDFRTFNDFFIRELGEGARPIDPDARAIVSPADGTLSQAGTLRGNRILQAKGIDYTRYGKVVFRRCFRNDLPRPVQLPSCACTGGRRTRGGALRARRSLQRQQQDGGARARISVQHSARWWWCWSAP
jgi:hypothetical protein